MLKNKVSAAFLALSDLQPFRGSASLVFVFLFFSNGLLAQDPVLSIAANTETKTLNGLYSSVTGTLSGSGNCSRNRIELPPGFPVNKGNYVEAVEKRELRSRTFKDNKGGIVVHYSSRPLHYKDKTNVYQPLDARLMNIHGARGIEWAAPKQQYPTYLYSNGATALSSSDNNNKIVFNLNCKINATEIDMSDYTVGVDGMFVHNVVEGIDKKIVFSENRIETDYIIQQAPGLVKDLIISEELVLLTGYRIQAEQISTKGFEKNEVHEEFVVYAPDNTEQARFRIPVFYDADKNVLIGKYNLVQQNENYVLEITVPSAWLNAPERSYPVTIDPVVTGPTSNYPSVFMDSCVLPVYAKDSMQVTIPAGVTITGFIVEDSYFADALTSPPALMKHGKMLLSTACGSVTFTCQGTAADSSGTCYLVPNTDLKTNLACCFTPSAVAQTFYITHGLGRDDYGPGCNQTYIYYSPFSNWPFSAYIIGKTVETTQAQWSVFPTTVCSDSCTIYLKATTKFGVPPYTITHPWAAGPSMYGIADGSCNSTGSDTIALSLPGCPSTCNASTTLDISPPIIVDSYGDTISGLTSKTITINPVPVASVNTTAICSDIPFAFTLSSCVPGSSFQWWGSNGSTGSGDIADVVHNIDSVPELITYGVVPTAGSCLGDTTFVNVEVNPIPQITVTAAVINVDPGVGTLLDASGGLTYQWLPFAGLSCNTCPAPLAAPVITTVYEVTGTNEYGCSAADTIEIYVNQGTEVLYIPNSFSPNSNGMNDLFCVYGTSIKKIDINIYDRWGELVFNSKDIGLGWDGKYKGTDVVGGVYVYSVTCEWTSGTHTRRYGTITVIR